jgi:hypothetical protein
MFTLDPTTDLPIVTFDEDAVRDAGIAAVRAIADSGAEDDTANAVLHAFAPLAIQAAKKVMPDAPQTPEWHAISGLLTIGCLNLVAKFCRLVAALPEDADMDESLPPPSEVGAVFAEMGRVLAVRIKAAQDHPALVAGATFH